MHRRMILLGACALAGCQTSLSGVKLDEAGRFDGGAQDGIPYALTRPQFKVTKDDKDKYSVSVGYVADSSQRYSLRLDPAILADSKFKMSWGEAGNITGLSASATDQAVPTIVAVMKMGASIAGGLAAPIGLSQTDTVVLGCLGDEAVVDVLVCAMGNADARAIAGGQAAPCATVRDDLAERIAPFKGVDGKDKGDPVASLYTLNSADKGCLEAVAVELEAEAKQAVGAPVARPSPPPAPYKRPSPSQPFGIEGLQTIAVSKFDDLAAQRLLTLSPTDQASWRSSTLLANARKALVERIETKKLAELRTLMASVSRYRSAVQPQAGEEHYAEKLREYETDRAFIYSFDVLEAVPCTPPKPLAEGVAGPPAPACPDRYVIDFLQAAFTEAGLATDTPAERLALVARVDALSKGLRTAATLDIADWRQRRIAHLDRKEGAAIRIALMTRPNDDPSSDLDVMKARTQKAAVVGLTPEYARLLAIRARLQTLPTSNLSGRLSPTGEYAALRQEGEKIEILLASRLAAESPPAPSKVAPEELPPDAPWVSGSCITASTSKTGWTALEGRKAPEYVIVLRRSDGSKSFINPADGSCGA